MPFLDPVLYLHEPDNDILEESYDVYKKAYEESYFNGTYIKDELKEVLFYNDMWSPDDDDKAKKAEEEVERLKVLAYENYYNIPLLRDLKRGIRFQESNFRKYKSKIHSLDHISCEGVASLSKSIWIISKTIKDKNKNTIDNKNIPLTRVMEFYNSKAIEVSEYRYIARNEPFRGMWSIGKKQSRIFDKPSIALTKDQLSLCQYASMYDNVQESHESPHEDVIDDDDCLDGWFIVQKREYEKNRNKKDIENMIGNSKVANSQEVYLMAKDQHTAKKIHDMNSVVGKDIIATRNQEIDNAGSIKFTQLSDVKQDISIQQTQQVLQKTRGR